MDDDLHATTRRRGMLGLSLIALLGLPASAAVQELSLAEGWNLVAIQVEPSDPTPDDGAVSPQDVFGGVGGLKSAWAFDNAEKTWSVYRNPASDPEAEEKNALPGAGISSVSFGDAFWIEMANNANLVINGSKPEEAPGIELLEGWNLVSIPIAGPEGNNALTREIPLVSALAIKGLDFDTILQWQAAAPSAPGYQRNTFGTNDDNANDEDFRFLDPDRAYWVNVTSPQTIKPDLLAIARGDVDVSPLGNFPSGPEDLSVSGESSPVPANEQTSIVFFENEDVQTVTFSNEGGGVMLWVARWTPDNPVAGGPWVTLSLEQSSPGTSTEMEGGLTVETEELHLRLDRKNLTRGSYGGTLELLTSAGNRSYRVTANVGGVEGEWNGFAVISSVNGKRNPVPDIDLNLSFYEDGDTNGLLRGAIDSSQSALWPIDVQLIGYITSEQGNSFQLAGSFVLPPGDQNQQPFDVFDAGSSGTDVDWNDDGYNPADRMNPFPFPIYRSVMMEGELVSANPIDDEGYRIEGTYREVIYGMLREPIQLEGVFQIDRSSPVPFASRSDLVAQNTPSPGSPIAKGSSPGSFPINAGAPAVSRTVEIDAEMLLREVRVSFDLKSANAVPLANTDVLIELEAPSGQRLLLHDGSPIDPASLRTASYPDALTPLGTSPGLGAFIRSVTDTSGTWRVWFTNQTGQNLSVQNTCVVLVGQPVVTIHGRVTDGSGGFVTGAEIGLTGLPFSQVLSGITDAEGNFTLSEVPAMPVNLSASLPGYSGGGSILPEQLLPSFSGGATNPEEERYARRFQPMPAVPVASLGMGGFDRYGTESMPFEIELTPEAGPVAIDAFPSYGMADLEVRLTALRASGPVTWDFGDGSNGSGIAVTHVYQDAGVYTVSMTYSGGLETAEVVVLPSPGNTPADAQEIGGAAYAAAGAYSAFFFQPRFTGGGSLPVSGVSPVIVTPQDYPASAPEAELLMVQHTYAASSDIDLAPLVSAPGADFSSDGFSTGLPAHPLNDQPDPGNGLVVIPAEDDDPTSAAAFNDPGWIDEDHNYLLWPDKWFIDTNLNGRRDVGEDDLAGVTQYDSNDSAFNEPRSTEGYYEKPIQRFRMTCNIGATISPVGISGASVRSADADPLESPPLEAGPVSAGASTNLYFKLTTNLLGGSNP